MKTRFISDEDDDPILSIVNLIDVFLVISIILLMILVKNPLNPFNSENVIVIENPSEDDMVITIKKGKELTRYKSSGEIGEGQGVKAGITYKLPNGQLVYVPE